MSTSPPAAKMTFLVLGASGGTGKHFVSRALADGHRVRAFVRSPDKLRQVVTAAGQGGTGAGAGTERLEVVQGSITDDDIDFDRLTTGVDAVVCMLGDREAQKTRPIVTEFLKKLVPAMRTSGTRKLLYQAGGMSRPYGGSLGPVLWLLRQTVGRSYDGQHKDNEAAMEYLATQCNDIDWIAHLAGIGSDGPSKGRLERSTVRPSIATHVDCADYSYRVLMDPGAVHTSQFSAYV